jgi:hypothetical protein
MSRSRHVTPARTAERNERTRLLIVTLQERNLRRDEIGSLLKIGPSGVRKYLADLCQMIELVRDSDEPVCRLRADEEKARAFLASLEAQPVSRPMKNRPPTPLELAARDPSRHIHVMRDDEEFKVRIHRGIPSHEPVMAHFFNLVPAGAWG